MCVKHPGKPERSSASNLPMEPLTLLVKTIYKVLLRPGHADDPVPLIVSFISCHLQLVNGTLLCK